MVNVWYASSFLFFFLVVCNSSGNALSILMESSNKVYWGILEFLVGKKLFSSCILLLLKSLLLFWLFELCIWIQFKGILNLLLI